MSNRSNLKLPNSRGRKVSAGAGNIFEPGRTHNANAVSGAALNAAVAITGAHVVTKDTSGLGILGNIG